VLRACFGLQRAGLPNGRCAPPRELGGRGRTHAVVHPGRFPPIPNLFAPENRLGTNRQPPHELRNYCICHCPSLSDTGMAGDGDRPRKKLGCAVLLTAVGNISVQYNLTSMGIGLARDTNPPPPPPPATTDPTPSPIYIDSPPYHCVAPEKYIYLKCFYATCHSHVPCDKLFSVPVQCPCLLD